MPRSSKRVLVRWILALACLVVVGVIGFGAIIVWQALHLPEAYAAYATAELIIDHLENHDDQWPQSWDDLFAAAERFKADGRHPNWEPSELPDYIAVDWDVDPTALRAIPAHEVDRRVKVITPRDGGAFVVEVVDANLLVWDYLNTAHAPSE